jgi:hypothetical protein
MISYKDYVAGWLDSSVHAFLGIVPPNSKSMRYALITCVDSNLSPEALLHTSPELKSVKDKARVLGSGIILPTRVLRQADSGKRLFFGFDEVCFFPHDNIKPKPASTWLVGPSRIDQAKMKKLSTWVTANSCSLALGDGEGLNFIVKARGLVKYLLGHSLAQPQPNTIGVASGIEEVAG